MNFEQVSLIKNDDKSRFEMMVKDHMAFIQFEKLDDHTLELYHTEVPQALEGQGVGKELVIRTFEYCKLNHIRVVATCPFISLFLKRHPEWEFITQKPTE